LRSALDRLKQEKEEEVVSDFIREKKILLTAKKQLLDRIREKAGQQAARSAEA
jgi:hypothetical protein